MLLEQNCLFIREHVALMKLTDTYDILSPGSGAVIGIAREEPQEWMKLLRLFVSKTLLPTTINVYETEGMSPVLTINRSFSFLRSEVTITGPNRESYGRLKRKLLTLGGGFIVYDANGMQVADVQGDWTGWNFEFTGTGGRQLGRVTKEWSGIGRELFTSADSYMVWLNEYGTVDPRMAGLLLATALSIDIIYKERR